ncbi:DNA-binding HxlR family transcriptional regulator [Streptomyces sp. SAI-135]|uniref:hypothetical protein n=1 Tax=Streptomyces sp. SAI-124 TaxID=3377730 RepID=UPI00247CE4BB|nr:DNA-binding HxlR family transcriptional regulator [Streptomyces sp. SAI-090]MDH6617480.1 DNA-binding HxlR family transcriptional regulator [Streptomyces sp. SAI-135]
MSDHQKACLIRGDGGRAIRGVLDRIGDKWTLLVVATLQGSASASPNCSAVSPASPSAC